MRYLRILALSVATLLGISSWAVGQDWAGAQRDRDANRDDLSNSPAFRQGKKQGESDALRNRRPNWRTTRWNDDRSRRDFEMGYKIGYREASYGAYYGSDQTSGRIDNRGTNERATGYADRGSGSGSGSGYADRGTGYSDSRNAPNSIASGSLTIQANNIIAWQTDAATARVYVVKDNKPEQVFAEGRAGSQGAPWIEQGHQFVFILRDLSGNELARQQLDLRSSSNQNQRGNR
jgi:hypothetical protein